MEPSQNHLQIPDLVVTAGWLTEVKTDNKI